MISVIGRGGIHEGFSCPRTKGMRHINGKTYKHHISGHHCAHMSLINRPHKALVVGPLFFALLTIAVSGLRGNTDVHACSVSISIAQTTGAVQMRSRIIPRTNEREPKIMQQSYQHYKQYAKKTSMSGSG